MDLPDHGNKPSASLADTLANKRRHASANRRQGPGGIHLFMLVASTLVAAGFCMLYITKPVIITLPDPGINLPGDLDVMARQRAVQATREDTATPENPIHEETNLRVQHVLNAATADGDLSRILLDVPVIYASRQLRWTDQEVSQAREIHARLADYHEQSRRLRELGSGLIDEWNELIERSIPAADLRADSPSLPANQQTAGHPNRPAELDTTEVIEIHPDGP